MIKPFIAEGAFAITPGASPLTKPANRLWVGGAGNVTVTCKDGSSVTFTGVLANTYLDVCVTHVTAATATNIVGLLV